MTRFDLTRTLPFALLLAASAPQTLQAQALRCVDRGDPVVNLRSDNDLFGGRGRGVPEHRAVVEVDHGVVGAAAALEGGDVGGP